MDGEFRVAPNRWWREPEFFCVILIVLSGHFLHLGKLSIRGEESRRFGIGWEMLQTGDWIVTRAQGEPIFFRPPLQNWLLAGSAWLFDSRDAWAIRLPGAICILLTSVLVYVYCRHFMPSLGAFAGAISYATMIQVLELGRLAEAESLFALLVSGSLLTWHWAYCHRWSDRHMWMAAYFFAGLGMLTKGFQAPIYLACSTGLFLICQGEWRRLFTLGHLAGLVTFALVYGIWFVPYLVVMGPAAGATMFFFDFLYHVDGPAGIRHLVEFPVQVLTCMLPWSLLLFAYASRSMWSSLGPARPMVVFLWSCIVATFPSCWLSQGGVRRYWLPMYPCVAALIGLVVQRTADATVSSFLRGCWIAYLTVLGLLMVIAAGAVLVVSWPALAPSSLSQPFADAAIYFVAASVLAGFTLICRRTRFFVPVAAVAAFVALTYSILVVNFQHADSVDIVARMQELKDRLPAQTTLMSLEPVFHRFAYHYGAPIERLSWPRRPEAGPAPGAYFCFDAEHQGRELPFTWEEVMRVECDRYRRPESNRVVIVGRRLPAGSSMPAWEEAERFFNGD